MMPSHSERQELIKRFANDIAHMRRCLQAAGKQVDDNDIVYAWEDYSGGLCAGWLMLSEQDDASLAILLKHLPPSRLMWRITIADAGDGSGDVMLSLPEELLAQVEWKPGDQLSIARAESGALILERLE